MIDTSNCRCQNCPTNFNGTDCKTCTITSCDVGFDVNTTVCSCDKDLVDDGDNNTDGQVNSASIYNIIQIIIIVVIVTVSFF
jgi:hypothetical protein